MKKVFIYSIFIFSLLCLLGISACTKVDSNSLIGTTWVANETETLKISIEFTTETNVIIREYGIDVNGVSGVERFEGTYEYYDSFVTISVPETNQTLSGQFDGNKLTIGKLVFIKQ